jgi:hypothetical protein
LELILEFNLGFLTAGGSLGALEFQVMWVVKVLLELAVAAAETTETKTVHHGSALSIRRNNNVHT